MNPHVESETIAEWAQQFHRIDLQLIPLKRQYNESIRAIMEIKKKQQELDRTLKQTQTASLQVKTEIDKLENARDKIGKKIAFFTVQNVIAAETQSPASDTLQ